MNSRAISLMAMTAAACLMASASHAADNQHDRIENVVIHVTTAGPAGAKVVATWAWVPGKPFNIRVPG